MAITREKKEKIVSEIKEDLDNQEGIVFVDFHKISADPLFTLRNELKENRCELKVVKKTLLKIALKEKDLPSDYIDDFDGAVAPVFTSESKIKLSKIIYNFGKEHPEFKILGGWWNEEFQPVEKVETLAQLPSYEELMARLVFGIKAPINNFVSVLNNNIKGLLIALNQIKQNK